MHADKRDSVCLLIMLIVTPIPVVMTHIGMITRWHTDSIVIRNASNMALRIPRRGGTRSTYPGCLTLLLFEPSAHIHTSLENAVQAAQA